MITVQNIQYHPSSTKDQETFSILIPSWNNLSYLKLCIESIRKNSAYIHQVVIHVNEGADGTLEWVRDQKDLCYTYSAANIGVCYALNAMATLARTDYILYMNDDMYACPDWDRFLREEIIAVGHEYFFISATAIEPHPQSRCSIGADFGQDILSFDEDKLLREFAKPQMNDWQGATWPPNVLHKKMWHLIGGYSVEFSPGMYSDPDFSMKLWQAGVRYFKGVANSRVYHFGSVSVKRVNKNKGYYMFISKWAMTAGTFSRYYLRRGSRFDGVLTAPGQNIPLSVKSIYKQFIAIFKK